MAIKTVSQIIDDTPDINVFGVTPKRSALYSIVGSLNYSLVSSAQYISNRLTRAGHNIVELEPREVCQLISEADERQDLLLDTRRVARCAEKYRAKLVDLTNNDEAGALHTTIDRMTSGQSQALNKAKFDELVALGEFDADEYEMLEEANRMDAEERADRLSAQRGEIEWLIDKVLSATYYDRINDQGKLETVDDSGYDEIEHLPARNQEAVHSKLYDALNCVKAAKLAYLRGRNNVEIGDIKLLSAALEDAKNLTVTHPDDLTEIGGKSIQVA